MGEMCWRIAGNDGEPLLHLRSNPTDRWSPYKMHPAGIPDKEVYSPGFPTFCKLVSLGWRSVSWDGQKYC
jgi:hypothetical protein